MKLRKTAIFAAGMLLSLTLCTSKAFAANYKVVKNDTLYKISTLFKTPVSTLKADNNLTSNVIYPGKVLEVSATVYTVKSGDTLYLIAKKYGITISSIRKANHKTNNLLIPGKTLILPGVKPDSAQTASVNKLLSAKTTDPVTADASSVIPYSASDLDLLARLIHAEAEGQPYDAMVAVGAVVVNRVQSPDWPSTISGVINQVSAGYYQFTPVKNGYIKNAATDTAIKAAKDALHGKDPSKGAMFYFDDSSTNQWLWSKPVTAKIGKMVFVE